MELSGDGARIELGEHPRFERRWRRLQTIIFSLFALLLLAGMTGLTGSGGWASMRRDTRDAAFTVETPRFGRARASQTLTITPTGPHGAKLLVHVDTSIAERLQVDSIAPVPIASASDAGGMTLLFALAPGASGPIIVRAHPLRAGRMAGTLSVDGRDLPISQIVWP